MGHSINEWIGGLIVPVGVVAAMTLLHLGFSVWRTLAILLPVLGALMLVMIVADPGPKAKGFVDGLKSRFR